MGRFTIDAASVLDAADEFTLSGDGLGDVLVADLGTPPTTASTKSFTYTKTADAFADGELVLEFLTGSWSLVDTLAGGGTIVPVVWTGATGTIDVILGAPEGYLVDQTSVLDAIAAGTPSEISLQPGVTLNSAVAPTRVGTCVEAQPSSCSLYRFAVTAPFSANATLANTAGKGTITRATGDFGADGFRTGQLVVLSGVGAGVDGTYRIETVTPTVITLSTPLNGTVPSGETAIVLAPTSGRRHADGRHLVVRRQGSGRRPDDDAARDRGRLPVPAARQLRGRRRGARHVHRPVVVVRRPGRPGYDPQPRRSRGPVHDHRSDPRARRGRLHRRARDPAGLDHGRCTRVHAQWAWRRHRDAALGNADLHRGLRLHLRALWAAAGRRRRRHVHRRQLGVPRSGDRRDDRRARQRSSTATPTSSSTTARSRSTCRSRFRRRASPSTRRRSSFTNFILGGDGLGTVQLDTDALPTLPGRRHDRPLLHHRALRTTGVVTATFAAESFAQLGGADARGPPDEHRASSSATSRARTATFIVHGVAIDVPFPVAAGFRLDPMSLSLTADEFFLDGAGLGTVVIDTTVGPRLLGDGRTVRYRITGQFAATGAVTATFTRGSWSGRRPGRRRQHRRARRPERDERPHVPRRRLRAGRRHVVGDAFVPGRSRPALDQRRRVHARRRGAAGITGPSGGSNLMNLGGGRYRYLLTGDFVRGLVDVVFDADAWQDTTAPGYGNLDETETFTVLGPTASLVDPVNEGVAGVRSLNDRGFIDVTIVAPGRHDARHRVRHRRMERVQPLRGRYRRLVDRHEPGADARQRGRRHVRVPLLDARHVHRGRRHRHVPARSRPDHRRAAGFAPAFWFVDDEGDMSSTPSPAPSRRPASSSARVATPNIGYLDVRLAPAAGDSSCSRRSPTPSRVRARRRRRRHGDVPPASRRSGSRAAPPGGSSGAARSPPARSTSRSSTTRSARARRHRRRAANAVGNVAEDEHFLVQQLTGELVDPLPTARSSTHELNDRGFFDVTYTVPDVRDDARPGSVTDLEPEFTVAPATGVHRHDRCSTRQRTPVLVSVSGRTYTYRYFYSGTLDQRRHRARRSSAAASSSATTPATRSRCSRRASRSTVYDGRQH